MATDDNWLDWHGGGSRSGGSSLDQALSDALDSVGGGSSGGPTRLPGESDSELRARLQREARRDRNGVLGDPATFTSGAPYGAPFAAFYTDTDVMLPLTLGPDAMLQLQLALQQAGWIKGDIDHPGQWDKQSQSAFRDLLTFANQAGQDWRAALQQSQQAQAGPYGTVGAPGTGTQPLTIQLPNPKDVRRQVEDLARSVTDVDLGDGFYKHVTDLWIDQLRNVQLRQGDDARTADHLAGRGGSPTVTATDPQGLESFTQDILEEEYPKAVKNAAIGDAEQAFIDAATGGVSA